jgi:F-type H+-transporting ATPase subunit alpha
MSLKASEISDLIRQRIQNFDTKAEARDVGTIIALTDGIVRIHGLADVQYGEMVEFPGGTMGLALNLEKDSVGAVVRAEDMVFDDSLRTRLQRLASALTD